MEACSPSSIDAPSAKPSAATTSPWETRFEATFHLSSPGRLSPTLSRTSAPLRRSAADSSVGQDRTFLQAETRRAPDNESSPFWPAHVLQSDRFPERISMSIECLLANSPIPTSSILLRTSAAESSEAATRSIPSSSAPSSLSPLSDGLIQRNHIAGLARPPARSCLILWSTWSCSELVANGSSLESHSLRLSRSSGSKLAESTQSPASTSLSASSITGNCAISAMSGASLARTLHTGCMPFSHSVLNSAIRESREASQVASDLPRWAHRTASL